MDRRVLVVDDEPEVRMLIGLFLRGSNYRVIAEAADGAEAVRLYNQLRPDVVLLDLMLPIVDGFTALRQIISAHPDARIVVVTVLRNSDTANRVREAGAREFVGKPFGRLELHRALDHISRPMVAAA